MFISTEVFITCVVTAFVIGIILGITVVPDIIFRIVTRGNQKVKDYIDMA